MGVNFTLTKEQAARYQHLEQDFRRELERTQAQVMAVTAILQETAIKLHKAGAMSSGMYQFAKVPLDVHEDCFIYYFVLVKVSIGPKPKAKYFLASRKSTRLGTILYEE